MPKLRPVSWKDFVKKIKLLGFEGPFYRGKHPYMIKDNLVLTIPNQHKKDIGIPLLQRVLRQAKISTDEWLS
ncbi:MAG: hypothetical protein A2046_05410 [Bacteroidetes bacterium GWA2_30_7]|nr:MAG: hypothetical protein A2046_05410 [Bacteroidetes bacterium GWA2_30_7]